MFTLTQITEVNCQKWWFTRNRLNYFYRAKTCGTLIQPDSGYPIVRAKKTLFATRTDKKKAQYVIQQFQELQH